MTPQNAAYLTADHPEEMEESIRNAAGDRDIELIVVTDVQAILGIGDWGTNGVSISTGKLMVYTAAAGIDPTKVLPVVIDADTDCQSLLDDPLYLGLHHHRIGGASSTTPALTSSWSLWIGCSRTCTSTSRISEEAMRQCC